MSDSLSPRGITLRHLRFALPARELTTLPQSPFFGQQSPVREIPFRSVPDFLKLPTDLDLGKSPVWRSIPRDMPSTPRAAEPRGHPATAAQLLEFGPGRKFIRESEHNFYAWSFAHTVKIDKQDNLWVTDKGSGMVIKFNPHVTPWHGAVCSERKSREGDDALDLGGTGCDLTSQKLVLGRRNVVTLRPTVVSARADDRHPPISWPVAQSVPTAAEFRPCRQDHRYYAVRLRQPFVTDGYKGSASRTSILGAIAGDRVRGWQQKGGGQPYPLTG